MEAIIENAANAANNDLIINQSYNINVTGFTYIKDYAVIKGKEASSGEQISVIIGDKQNFGMSEMFQLKAASGIRAKYRQDKTTNGTTYKQFQLEEILF